MDGGGLEWREMGGRVGESEIIHAIKWWVL